MKQTRWLSRYSQIVRRGRVVNHRLNRTRREAVQIDVAGWKASQRARDWFASNFSDFIRMTVADGVLPIVATQATLVAEENLSSDVIASNVGNHIVGLSMESLLELWQWANVTIVDIARQHDIPVVELYGNVPHTMTYLEDHTYT